LPRSVFLAVSPRWQAPPPSELPRPLPAAGRRRPDCKDSQLVALRDSR